MDDLTIGSLGLRLAELRRRIDHLDEQLDWGSIWASLCREQDALVDRVMALQPANLHEAGVLLTCLMMQAGRLIDTNPDDREAASEQVARAVAGVLASFRDAGLASNDTSPIEVDYEVSRYHPREAVTCAT